VSSAVPGLVDHLLRGAFGLRAQSLHRGGARGLAPLPCGVGVVQLPRVVLAAAKIRAAIARFFATPGDQIAAKMPCRILRRE